VAIYARADLQGLQQGAKDEAFGHEKAHVHPADGLLHIGHMCPDAKKVFPAR
jgi:hypothetical protein